MATYRIEMDRGNGWEVRGEGSIPDETPVERIERDLRDYALQYPHRALVNGEVVATQLPKVRRRVAG